MARTLLDHFTKNALEFQYIVFAKTVCMKVREGTSVVAIKVRVGSRGRTGGGWGGGGMLPCVVIPPLTPMLVTGLCQSS